MFLRKRKTYTLLIAIMGDILIFEQYLSLIFYYFYNRIFIPEVACFYFLLIYFSRSNDFKNQTQLL